MGWAMINHAFYRKLAVLKNGQQVMIILLSGDDRNSLPPSTQGFKNQGHL
jgi:hypothetical protein